MKRLILHQLLKPQTFSLHQNIVNVNPLTGAANVVIPIYTVTSGQVSLPVNISYAGSGVKPKDAEGTAGMGWQLNAGGQISRVVRGLPDDCTFDNSGQARLGWMSTSNSGATYASASFITNNGTTCSTGVSDITYINTNIPATDDTEPDMFYVSAPGLSCQLVYDRGNGLFNPVNYQDLVISYTLFGGTGNNAAQITSFTITNDKGITYVFAAPETVTQTTSKGTGSASYFTNKYNFYQNGITYYDSWNLVSMTDASGNGIFLNYSPVLQPRTGKDPIDLYLSGSTTESPQYTVMDVVTPQILASIGTTNPYFSATDLFFTWNAPQEIVQTGQSVISSITGMGRTMQFAYSLATAPGGTYSRAFLTNFSDFGCGTPINYQFGYTAVNPATGTTSLADSTSTQLDYWGYYSSSASATTLLPAAYVNPSTSTYPRYVVNATSSPGSAYQYGLGATVIRAVNSSSIADGALNSITNAQGGVTTITYEPNDYYDVPSGTTIQGGGIRVKQVTASTGSGATNNIVRNYTYVNPAGATHPGYSSGEPLTLPQFAFTISSNGSGTGQAYWANATALSAYDLSEDDHTIMYAYSTVSQTGAGSTLYNFNVPATYWNINATPICSGCTTAEWFPSVNYAASYSCPSTNGPIANLTYSYPFAPNPNYDFERGQPIKITNFNDNGHEASETDFTYQRSYSAATPIKAFRWDDSPALIAKFYSQYTVFYHTSELAYTVTNKTFDTNNGTQAQVATTTYSYTSPNHKLLTQQSAVNSDNSTVNTYFNYIKDYAPNAGASNTNINAMYNLKLLNINAPVETYVQIVRGATTVTTGAALNLYSVNSFSGTNLYLPSQQLKLVQPDGEASFTHFSINTSAQSITHDPNYFFPLNYSRYDNTGHLQTTSDNYKNIQTSFFDLLSQHTTAVFKNANYNEVAFNDFDSQFAPAISSFSISGTGSYNPVGSHAGKAAGLTATTQTVSTGVITKNLLAKNYIFSIWINPSAAGSLTVTGASTNYTVSYSALSWGYHELKIPASALASTFTLSFTSSANISIDDVLLYPDVAEATTATYDALEHFKIAETNTNGVSSYYTNDQWGRVAYAYDQDNNIILRKQYVNAAGAETFLTPTVAGPPKVYVGVSAFFTNTSPITCFTSGITYKWDFGDGTAPYTTTSYAGLAHTYTSTGDYTITLTVTSAIFGTKSGTLLVHVITIPNTTINYVNSCQPGGKFPTEIKLVTFSKGTTLMYSFNTQQLINGASVVPDTYTIQITPQGDQYNSSTAPTGYNSVVYMGALTQCFPYTGGTFTITDNLTLAPSIYLNITPATCSGH